MLFYPKHKASELIGVLSLAGSLLLVLSLLSYSGMDPSASVSSSSQQYANYVGRVGALSSDFLFQILGLAALYLPVLLLVVGYKTLRNRPMEYPCIKLFAFCCTLATLSAALTLLAPNLPESVNFTAGGVLGILFANLLLMFLNTPGSLVVVATLLVLSLMITTRLSIDQTLTWIQELNWKGLWALRTHYTAWRKRRQNRKKLALLRQDKRRLVTQSPPKKVFLNQQAAAVSEGERPAVKVMLPPTSPAEAVEEDSFNPALGPQIDRPYRTPPLSFLQVPAGEDAVDEKQLIQRAEIMATKCAEFDVHGRVLQIHPGPIVTTFEFKPEAGIKYSRITNLADDLCLALKAESIRIDRIPGKNTVGIEVPNLHRQPIRLRELLEGAAFQQSGSRLTLALGKLINGNTYISDLATMPHLLIAGATGSGKSVALNCAVCSILYKSSPAQVRFIMIDPKRLELGVYEDIPHLLTPIVTNPKQAAIALSWTVSEMEGRYKLLAQEGVRNIAQYNKLMHKKGGDSEENAPLPYIVLIVDELADLMMTAGKEVEASVTRLAQMARAIGIHLILATQRPSVDVLTGLIKANFPCRLSFRVSSKIDSRTILDCNGAEQLLGQGDMLFLPPGTSRLIRLHGGYLSEKEIHKVTDFLKKQAQPEYQEEVLIEKDKAAESTLVKIGDLEDELYQEAARFVVETGKASTSLLQRRLRIGYGRAARLLDMMQHEGLIAPPEGSKAREVLVPPDYFSEIHDR
jgi:S-DNA-T family DNA segregation ATPase FtsK/SpoIIIE